MRLKETCLCTFLGLGLLISSIIGAFFVRDIIMEWMCNNPIRVVIVMWAIIIDSVAVVALLFKNSYWCPSVNNCPYRVDINKVLKSKYKRR